MTIEAVFQWLDGTTKTFKRFISIDYNIGINRPGGFTLTLPDTDDALDILMNSNFYLMYNGKKKFGGLTQFRRIQEGKSITIKGIDFTGMIGLRKGTYEFTSDTESSIAVKTLLQQFIRGESENIPNFNIDYDKYVIASTTLSKWKYTRTSILEACVNIAKSSTSPNGSVGYVFWVDPELYVHYEPMGANKMLDILPLSNITFDEDQRDIFNLVEYFGGKEKTYPVIPDSWTDYGNAPDWIARSCRECQTVCQNNCEAGCQVCGQDGFCQTTCEVTCQDAGCGQVCDTGCLTVCQDACRLSCQICSETPPGGLVGI